MKKIARKLRSRRGETLTEMLVSIVILGLSIAMMATMIITSTKITERSTAKDSEYRDQLSYAEGHTQEITGDFYVTIEKKDSMALDDKVEIPVKIYGKAKPDGDTEGVLKSYEFIKNEP